MNGTNAGTGETSAQVARVARLSRAHRGGAALPETFVIEAERLLERSRWEPELDGELTWAYRGALRAAGAVIQHARKKRRRLPAGSAWSRVRVLSGEFGDWCDVFERHARLVARVEMGLEAGLTREVVSGVYQDACDFLDEVRGAVGYLPDVA
ncbi:MAG TPA: hypothetical protein H9870_13725 [Candidatus Corynebacterium avicola]|uniref:SAV-6107-like HEPN domain-containing protein n=1 Tax=Candidatus Corynebacterium avicola TaxID=2838527 RepID=A0A9D1RTW4_9CORY|nr:hypothetical protein [Candidatus Corynebacterium avicola]